MQDGLQPMDMGRRYAAETVLALFGMPLVAALLGALVWAIHTFAPQLVQAEIGVFSHAVAVLALLLAAFFLYMIGWVLLQTRILSVRLGYAIAGGIAIALVLENHGLLTGGETAFWAVLGLATLVLVVGLSVLLKLPNWRRMTQLVMALALIPALLFVFALVARELFTPLGWWHWTLPGVELSLGALVGR